MLGIYVKNQSTINNDGEVQRAIEAINLQLGRDFASSWDLSARLIQWRSKPGDPEGIVGDATIFLIDSAPDERTYHAATASHKPFGFVLTTLREGVRDLVDAPWLEWSVLLSHEAIEMVANPLLDLLIRGPHPVSSQQRTVFYCREVCDPVARDTYTVLEVPVADFVLPCYYDIVAHSEAGPYAHKSIGLAAFGSRPGGWVDFWDPKEDDWVRFPGEAEDATFAPIANRVRDLKGLAYRPGRCARQMPSGPI